MASGALRQERGSPCVLKSELAGGQMPSGLFGANAAWWAIAILAHNLNAVMKKLGLGRRWLARRMKALRFHLIAFARPRGAARKATDHPALGRRGHDGAGAVGTAHDQGSGARTAWISRHLPRTHTPIRPPQGRERPAFAHPRPHRRPRPPKKPPQQPVTPANHPSGALQTHNRWRQRARHTGIRPTDKQQTVSIRNSGFSPPTANSF